MSGSTAGAMKESGKIIIGMEKVNFLKIFNILKETF
jgi:hypothetical protein